MHRGVWIGVGFGVHLTGSIRWYVVICGSMDVILSIMVGGWGSTDDGLLLSTCLWAQLWCVVGWSVTE